MTSFTIAMSADCCRLLTLMPSFLALNSPSVARVNGVAVTFEGGVDSSDVPPSDVAIAPQPTRVAGPIAMTNNNNNNSRFMISLLLLSLGRRKVASPGLEVG